MVQVINLIIMSLVISNAVDWSETTDKTSFTQKKEAKQVGSSYLVNILLVNGTQIQTDSFLCGDAELER